MARPGRPGASRAARPFHAQLRHSSAINSTRFRYTGFIFRGCGLGTAHIIAVLSPAVASLSALLVCSSCTIRSAGKNVGENGVRKCSSERSLSGVSRSLNVFACVEQHWRWRPRLGILVSLVARSWLWDRMSVRGHRSQARRDVPVHDSRPSRRSWSPLRSSKGLFGLRHADSRLSYRPGIGLRRSGIVNATAIEGADKALHAASPVTSLAKPQRSTVHRELEHFEGRCLTRDAGLAAPLGESTKLSCWTAR